MSNLPIRLRTANPEDVSFIFNSWLKSYRTSEMCKPMTNEVYFAEQHRLIENLVTSCKVIIACNEQDPKHLYGWICAGDTDGIFTLHYIYIKQAFRKMGLAKMLLEICGHDGSTMGIYTHHTLPMKFWAGRYILLYQPYVLTLNYNKVKDGLNE